MILAAVSVGMSLYSAFAASAAARKAAAERAAALRSSAALLRSIGAQDAQKVRDNMPRILGAQAAGYAASGVRMDSGSPMEVAYDTIRQINTDVFHTVWNAEMKARAAEAGADVAISEGNSMASQVMWQNLGKALDTAGTASFQYAELKAKGGG